LKFDKIYAIKNKILLPGRNNRLTGILAYPPYFVEAARRKILLRRRKALTAIIIR
jgi:hypothetical protein